MPVKHMIGSGIGFSPGGVKYIVTRGLSIGAFELVTLLATVTVYSADESIPIISGASAIDIIAGDDTIPTRSNK